MTSDQIHGARDLPGSTPVTVVVPMRNSEKTIAQTLDSLLAQTFSEFELVVADNGSTDRSIAIAESYVGRFGNVLVIDASISPGSGFARRAGVEASYGELLIFVDSDDVVSTNYVGAMASALRRTTFVHSAQDMSLLNPPWVVSVQPGLGTRTQAMGDWKFGGSATLGVRRSAYDEVGGFCTEPEIAEDNDFCFRMHVAGHSLQIVPDAIVHVRQKYGMRSAFAQARYYGRCHGHTNRLWRPMGLPVESEWTLARRALRLLSLRQLRTLHTPEGRFRWIRECGSLGARTWANIKDVLTRRKFRPATGLIRPSEDPFLQTFRQLRRRPTKNVPS